jgi:hypothetical protein
MQVRFAANGAGLDSVLKVNGSRLRPHTFIPSLATLELRKQRPSCSREPARDRSAAVRHAAQYYDRRHHWRGLRLEPDSLWKRLFDSGRRDKLKDG